MLIVPAWLDWQPRVSLPLWFALAAIFLLVWGAYAIRFRRSLPATRRAWTLGLMLAGGCVPLILLLNPTWVEALPPPDGRPLVTILVDTSASMDVVDSDSDSTTRIARAVDLAQQVQASLDPSYETRLLAFDAAARMTDPKDLSSTAQGQRTDLAGAIEAASGSDRPRGQAVVLLSDGIHNAGSARRVVVAARAARGRGAPVYPIAVGEPLAVKNLSVETGVGSRLAFVNQPVQLAAKVTNRGFDPVPINVQLVRDGEVVEAKSVTVEGEQTQDVTFSASPENAGLYRYTIQVDSVPGEATEEDNSASLLVRVVDAPIGVLLLEGKPYWDSKFLARNLAGDPSVQLESLVKMRSDRFLHRNQASEKSNDDSTPPWQVIDSPEQIIGSAESLQKYQVIVLGRDAEAYLDDTTVTRLRNWVSTQGGSLVCARGAPQSALSEKLGRMLPVRWTRTTERRFRAQVTEATGREGWLIGTGDSDPLAAMPSLVTATSPEKRGGLPRVLVASGEGADAIPVVTYQPYGAGRTVVVEGTGMWRWALLPPEFSDADSIYPNVWNGLLQWLVSRVALTPGQDRALQSDRTKFSTESPASATLLVRETVSVEQMPIVLLTRDGEETITEVSCEPVGDQPGVFQARFGKLQAGNYLATLKDADETDRSVTAFEVRRPIEESLDLNPRSDLLAAIAKESGGRVLENADGEAIAEIIEQQITDGLPVETSRIPAWDRWWVLAGILCMWTAAWTLRRQSGLV